jgi:hypothetical protein
MSGHALGPAAPAARAATAASGAPGASGTGAAPARAVGRVRRRFRVPAVAIVLLAMVASPVLAETSFTPSAVSFTVDDAAKTIIANVNLAFYNRSCVAGSSCAADPAVVARIVKAIEDMWNTGQKVRCYTFSVKVVARSVGSQSAAGQNEVDVGLDASPEVVRGYVAITSGSVAGGGVSNPLGDTPADRIDPAHNVDEPTTWPTSTYEQVYAHEFGHILGLEDNYDKQDPRQLVKGASEDLMFRKQGVVTQEMVKRVIDRSGQVDPKKLKCGWFITGSSPDGYTIKGLKCDDTDGEWLLRGVIAGPLQSDLTDTVTIAAGSLVGTFQSSTITVTSGIVATVNAHGRASIANQPDGSVIVTLDATTARGTAGGEVVGNLPFPALHFTWLPTTGSECAIAS